jgi:rhamnopyranosyl-N-acetylglucosaminyl-diphospho-decaprenol beta-1,3/1,4-galactofuranosyltransferase
VPLDYPFEQLLRALTINKEVSILSEKICVVIVTFNSVSMLANLLNDIRIQSRLPDEVIVVDNASLDQTESMVRVNYPTVNYIKLAENLGSAGGYYEGILRAAESSDFIYTLDDDACLNTDTLFEIVKGFKLLEKSLLSRIAAVRSVGKSHPEEVPTKLDICPWRGTLFKTSVVREVGLPSLDYFLYGEDLEYSLRLTEKGYSFYWIPTSICQERDRDQNGKTYGNILGKKSVRYQDLFRLYYAFRNEISIYKQYHLDFKLFHTFMYAAMVVLWILITEGGKGEKAIEAVTKGMLDGFRGKLGKSLSYIPNTTL